MNMIERWNIWWQAHQIHHLSVNKITVSPLQGADDRCVVEFTGYFEVKDEKTKTGKEETLQDTYLGILNGLKKMHEGR
jgi:hypothetical protein